MAITATTNGGDVSLNADKVSYDLVETDVEIITSGRRRIPAHSGILASASPVLTNIMEKPRKIHGGSSKRVIKILGVPCEAVSVFVRFLYSPSSLTENEMETYGIHLLAISHVYMVTQLKQRCTKGVGESVTTENVVDVLQLARLCDAPDLFLKCMRLIQSKFKTVEQTEGWKFLQEHDPFLELDILQFIDEAESRKKRRRRHRREQNLYMQLSEAMECIEHICTEGCTLVGPSCSLDNNKSTSQVKTGPCSAFSTCYGLQLLIRHFAVCKKRVDGKGCVRCKRMIQLLKLHSSVCDDQSESCRVPLCRQFKKRGEKDKKMVEETKWKVLVRRVASAKAMSSLSQSKKNKSEVLFKEEVEDFIRIRNKLI
ncbi:PREDICTED: BTB/POZ and TAZ domain-containing protein 1 isoform X1 [Camelina sativa]|uniref:BTB/POZ and TAZ domain-containing protein 1 isoform X1 n=1 Tax=Camelina sativa TaxID=90675 RepID=A0ABM0UPK5_CAMSA|nr:PREDICTED: BTB/POZ and TAZ domain-containing protein 1 isoform X1 [Camelina sativa]